MVVDLTGLERELKVSQEKNIKSFSEIIRKIQPLGGQVFPLYDPSDPLKNLRDDYFQLTQILIKAQQKKENKKMRQDIRNATESLIVNAVNFHLNFFRPSLLGISERSRFKRLLREMKNTFTRKNADYGNAFRFWGITGLLVRIGDKFFRLEQLSQENYQRKVPDELIPDTALDLANYGIMLLMLLDEDRPLKFGS